jgi:hypothetical protein
MPSRERECVVSECTCILNSGDRLVSSPRKRAATALRGSKSGPNECNTTIRRDSARAVSCAVKKD